MASRKKNKAKLGGRKAVASNRHKEQEAIAAEYAGSICESVDGITPHIEYGETCKLEGLSGHKHQIDVAVWGPNDLIIIECKHKQEKSQKRNIGVDQVLQFFGRLYDIRQQLLYNSPFAVQKVQKLNFQGGLSFGSTVL